MSDEELGEKWASVYIRAENDSRFFRAAKQLVFTGYDCALEDDEARVIIGKIKPILDLIEPSRRGLWCVWNFSEEEWKAMMREGDGKEQG
jgi:hypothetical protein